MSINRVEISGNLGRDPVLRYTSAGQAVLGICMCVNDRVKRDDKWVDKPNWVDVTVFGPRGEALSKILEKGAHVAVAGRLSQQSWKDKETGKARSRLEVIAEDVDIFGRAPAKQDGPRQEDVEIYDEEIPF